MTPIELSDAAAMLRERLPQLAAVYVYGSQARGDARQDSDLDLAVYTRGEPLSAMDLWTARQDLVVASGVPVDLVHLDTAPTILQRQIIDDGVRLLTLDALAADLFELSVLREYDDLKRRRAPLEADIVDRGRVFA